MSHACRGCLSPGTWGSPDEILVDAGMFPIYVRNEIYLRRRF